MPSNRRFRGDRANRRKIMTETKKEESGRYAVTDWQREDVGFGSSVSVDYEKAGGRIEVEIYFSGLHGDMLWNSKDELFLEQFDDPSEVYAKGCIDMVRYAGRVERVTFENWIIEVAASWHAQVASAALRFAENEMKSAGPDISKEIRQRLQNEISEAKRGIQYIEDKYQPLFDPQYYQAKKASAAKRERAQDKSNGKNVSSGKQGGEGVSV